MTATAALEAKLTADPWKMAIHENCRLCGSGPGCECGAVLAITAGVWGFCPEHFSLEFVDLLGCAAFEKGPVMLSDSDAEGLLQAAAGRHSPGIAEYKIGFPL